MVSSVLTDTIVADRGYAVGWYSLGDRWRSFWHTMTSSDRHATPNSPYRTGRHVLLDGGRNAPLTSVASSGFESRSDLAYVDDSTLASSTPFQNGSLGSPFGGGSPTSPYAPGMRPSSATARGRSANGTSTYGGAAAVAGGEIPLQSFQDGLPPPPPVAHSWKRIDRWAEDNFTELFDQLAEGASPNDLNELEYMLDCSLPADVRESWQLHDGQERGGTPTGIIFGCMLLDCEEIVQEWQQWRTVNQEFLSDHVRLRSPVLRRPDAAAPPPSSSASASSSNAQTSHPQPPPSSSLWRQQLLAKQDSQPPGAVRKAYAHPGWIPLARDWGGNNIAVDLAPGPAGTWGQVVVFGRDFDCKYVVARSWGAFLASVADDLEGDRWFVDDDSQELRLREGRSKTVDSSYLDVLRSRADQKYGPRLAKPKPRPIVTTNPSAGAKAGTAGDGPSPRVSPLGAEFERGRPRQRFAGHGVGASPMSRTGRSSPLAKVSEEVPAAVPTHIGLGSRSATPVSSLGKASKLIDAPTPVEPPDTEKKEATARSSGEEARGAPAPNGAVKGLGMDVVDGVGRGDGRSAEKMAENELRTVEL
ncbi:MAG: Cell wall assembly regulator [Lichina confinis]|nr:MAG: Cell wall assembly regulator [Lichina confinis]